MVLYFPRHYIFSRFLLCCCNSKYSLVLVYLGILFVALVPSDVSAKAAEEKLPIEFKRLLLDHQYKLLNEKLIPMANSGRAFAQYQLGLSYQKGLGLKENKNIALDYLEKAANQGFVKAQFSAAILILSEKNLLKKRGKESALRYLKRASESGHSLAKKRLENLTNEMPFKGLNSKKIDEKYFHAAQFNKIEILDESLKNGAYINAISLRGQSAMHLAVENHSSEAVQILLNNHINLEFQDVFGNTVLHYAVQYQMEEIPLQFLSKKILEKNNKKGETPLLQAVSLKREKIAKLLLESGANPLVFNRKGEPLLEIAKAKNLVSLSNLIESLGGRQLPNENTKKMEKRISVMEQQLNQPVYKDWDILMLATWSDELQLVDWLLKEKRDLLKVSDAMVLALNYKTVRIAERLSLEVTLNKLDQEKKHKLISGVFDADALDSFKNLHRSSNIGVYGEYLLQTCLVGSQKISKYLIESGARLDVSDPEGRSCLHHAAGNGSIIIVRQLLLSNSSLSVRDRDGQTALWLSVNNNQFAISQLLLQAGADVNAVNKKQQSPLMRAVLKNNRESVQLMLESGANLNIQTDDGNTVLIAAAQKASADIISLLLTAGSDVSVRNKKSLTALMMASVRGDRAIVEMLLDAGADPKRRARNGKNSIVMANSQMLKTLLSR